MKKYSVLAGAFCIAMLIIIPKTDAVSVVNDLTRQVVDYQKQWTAQADIISKAQATIADARAEQDRLHKLAQEARAKMCETSTRHCNFKIFVTSYNPVAAQTDASPCHGAGGNLCELVKSEQPIAVSRDLLKYFKYGDRVRMHSDIQQCNGVFVVRDTMNKRWTKRADIFFMERSRNTSCHASMSLFEPM